MRYVPLFKKTIQEGKGNEKSEKLCKWFQALNRDGIRRFLIRIFGVDPVIIKNSREVIDFMLQNNRVVSPRGDFDILLQLCIVGFDFDFIVADDVAGMFFIDGQASFPAV